MFAESDRYIYNNGTLEASVGKFCFRAKMRPTRKMMDYVQLFNGVHAMRKWDPVFDNTYRKHVASKDHPPKNRYTWDKNCRAIAKNDGTATTPSFFKEARATRYAIDAYEFNLDEGEDFPFITTRLSITLPPVVVRSVTGTGYNSKIEKAKRKALREGGDIAPTEVEDSADEDEETDNKSENSDEEPITDEEEDSYEDAAPEIISSEEKKELLATKKACEAEGLELTLHEQRLLDAREEYERAIPQPDKGQNTKMKIAKVTKAPMITLEEKADLLATKEAGEVEGYDLMPHEQRLLDAREEYDQAMAGARKFLEGTPPCTNESYKDVLKCFDEFLIIHNTRLAIAGYPSNANITSSGTFTNIGSARKAATQLKHSNALETQQETSDEEMASTPSKPVKQATTPKGTATKVPRASAAKKNRANTKFPDTISIEMAEVTPSSKKRAASTSTTTRKVAPKKFGQDSSDEELPDTPSGRPAKKAKLAKLSDSDEEEIAEDEPLEEPSQPKDANATTEEHKNKSKAELDKLVKKELIKIILEMRKAAEPSKELEELQYITEQHDDLATATKTHISNVCETLFEMTDIHENLITPRLNPNNYSSSRPAFVKGATKAIESIGGAIDELPDRNLTLLKSTEALGKKVARGNMVRNVYKKTELKRWSGKWKDGETMDE
ncbi:hypothetical protein BLS_002535 [Venturia inaequalis]|uniref:Uncharacterized protein n=1 Tax=Venturia inaequalis TaxID=5025 RepID=A0A8H3U1G1_VENIN|nr:hypothetical protein BLS_002535 [Venturia inaequalis]